MGNRVYSIATNAKLIDDICIDNTRDKERNTNLSLSIEYYRF